MVDQLRETKATESPEIRPRKTPAPWTIAACDVTGWLPRPDTLPMDVNAAADPTDELRKGCLAIEPTPSGSPLPLVLSGPARLDAEDYVRTDRNEGIGNHRCRQRGQEKDVGQSVVDNGQESTQRQQPGRHKRRARTNVGRWPTEKGQEPPIRLASWLAPEDAAAKKITQRP
jgi:hypothetical protein